MQRWMFSGPEACLAGCMRFRHQIHQIGADQEAHLIGFSGPWIWIQKNVHVGKCLRHRVYIGDFDRTNLGLVLLFPTRTEGCILWCPRMSWRNLLHGISNSWLNQTIQRKFSEGACLAKILVYDGACAFVTDIQRWMCCCLHLWIHSYSWCSLHVVVAQLTNKSVLGLNPLNLFQLKTPASVRDYLKQYHGANKLQRIANWQQISVASPKPVRIILYYSIILSAFAHASSMLMRLEVKTYYGNITRKIWTTYLDDIWEHDSCILL